jgi:hypothetical protein
VPVSDPRSRRVEHGGLKHPHVVERESESGKMVEGSSGFFLAVEEHENHNCQEEEHMEQDLAPGLTFLAAMVLHIGCAVLIDMHDGDSVKIAADDNILFVFLQIFPHSITFSGNVLSPSRES